MNDELGERLKLARKRAGLSQKELADSSGVTQTTISELERGVSSSTSFVVQIASALGVSALWLATNKGSIEPTPWETVDSIVSTSTGLATIARVDAYLHSAVINTENALEAASPDSSASSRKIRSALALLCEARALLAEKSQLKGLK